jgi:fumarate hydratase class II
MPPPLIKAFGVLKKAAAQVNGTYGECGIQNLAAEFLV